MAPAWMVVAVAAGCLALVALSGADLLPGTALYAPAPATATPTAPAVLTGPRAVAVRSVNVPPIDAIVPGFPAVAETAVQPAASPAALLPLTALAAAASAVAYAVGRYTGRPAPPRRLLDTEAVAMAAGSGEAVSRRTAMQGAALAATLAAGPAWAAIPSGFALHKDQYDGYEFLYPFGWQPLEVAGQDVLYKDIIEPLETMSVTIIPTDKESITELGDLERVCFTFADKFLTSSDQAVTLLDTKQEVDDGITYYSMEFLAAAPNYTRHALAVVAICNNKLYTCLTGASERRWPKMKDRLQTAVDSFTVRKVVKVVF
eukprot:EG_transcript_14464